jgi:hypothetical protein
MTWKASIRFISSSEINVIAARSTSTWYVVPVRFLGTHTCTITKQTVVITDMYIQCIYLDTVYAVRSTGTRTFMTIGSLLPHAD